VDQRADAEQVAFKLMVWSWKLTDEQRGGLTSRQFIRALDPAGDREPPEPYHAWWNQARRGECGGGVGTTTGIAQLIKRKTAGLRRELRHFTATPDPASRPNGLPFSHCKHAVHDSFKDTVLFVKSVF
jgi:hypothetical protein